MTACLSDDEVCRLVAGASLSASLETHLDGCPACFELVAEAFGGERGGVDNVEDAPAPARAGRYELRGLLGEGGMGRVFAAHDPQLDREVAIKFVRADVFAGRSQSAARERLRGEALAMARLSHPNVVHVYEVGEEGGELFVAMELVRGVPLQAWLAARARTLDEITAVFAAAAHGLAAAHVHRDVKPANILVDEAGHVRVSDFGLARIVDEDDAERRADVSMRASTLVGTPLYMAPECLRGRRADARADQYSFCAALYEALVRRPAVAVGVLRRLRMDHDAPWPEIDVGEIPQRLRSLVRRGLAERPSDRHPDMLAIAAGLARVRPRRARAVAAIAGLALVPTTLIALRGRAEPACGGEPPELAAVWNDRRSAGLTAHLAEVAPSYGAEAAAAITAIVDDHVARWSAARREVCEAALVRHEHGEQTFELQRACLGERLQALDALLTSVETGDAEVGDRASQAFGRWSISACADAVALLGVVPEPDDPDLRARIAEVRVTLVRARAEFELGRASEAEGRLAAIDAEAARLDHPPLDADRLRLRGELELSRGAAKQARGTLHAALRSAIAARDDRIQVVLYIDLADTVGDPSIRDEIGVREYLELAQAVLARIGAQPELRRDLAFGRAQQHQRLGQLDDALAAVDLALAEADADPAGAITIRSSRAGILRDLGRYDDAIAEAESAVARSRELLGPRHPHVAEALGELAITLVDAGQAERGRAPAEAALALRLDNPASNPALVARAYNDVGTVHWRLGEMAQARDAFTRSLAIWDQLGVHSLSYGITADNLAVALMRLGDLDAAEAQAHKAIEVLRTTAADGHYELALAYTNLAELLYQRKRHDESIATIEEALRLNTDSRGAEHPQNAIMLLLLAKNLLVLDRPGQAATALERALALRADVPDDGFVRGVLHYALGRARERLGDSAGARAQIEAAAVQLRGAGATGQADLARAEAWLAQHRSDRDG